MYVCVCVYTQFNNMNVTLRSVYTTRLEDNTLVARFLHATVDVVTRRATGVLLLRNGRRTAAALTLTTATGPRRALIGVRCIYE